MKTYNLQHSVNKKMFLHGLLFIQETPTIIIQKQGYSEYGEFTLNSNWERKYSPRPSEVSVLVELVVFLTTYIYIIEKVS